MFRNVIVGVDRGPGARDAIALARALVAPSGQMTLAHVPLRIGWGESRSVAHNLQRLVEKSGGDLLVVGSSRHGGWGRTLLGDDTRAALDRAPCAVAVAPRGYALEEHAIQRVGVGYHGTRESEHALTVASALSRELGATVTAFQAIPVSEPSAPTGSITDGTSVDDLIAEASDELSSIPEVDSEVAYGEPAVELAFFSDSVDLLVVGAHNREPSPQTLNRSTAGELARSTGCPLLVVTGQARAREASTTARSPELTRPIG